MKKCLTIVLLLLIQVGYSQAKKENKAATDPKKQNAKSTVAKSSATGLVGKDWKLSETEKWGVIKGPTEENKNDHFTLTNDTAFVMFLKKKDRKGTWKKAGNNLQFTCDNGEKLIFKILKSEPGKLKVDWREDESMNTLITFSSDK
jgi:uncharacterized protein (UPF0333 family)